MQVLGLTLTGLRTVFQYFFASFLSRDEAYRLIVNGWSNHSAYARIYLGSHVSQTPQGSPGLVRLCVAVEEFCLMEVHICANLAHSAHTLTFLLRKSPRPTSQAFSEATTVAEAAIPPRSLLGDGGFGSRYVGPSLREKRCTHER